VPRVPDPQLETFAAFKTRKQGECRLFGSTGCYISRRHETVPMTEQELLGQYVKTGSEEAFRQIVAAHIDFVYSSAKWRVRDAHLAEDVTQAVFMALAHKAATLHAKTALAGWLFNATGLAAANLLRAERRRQRHEREAMEMNQAAQRHDGSWEDLLPHLQNGLDALGQRERDAILLRYFQGLSMRETGLALGILERTAAKRVSRALGKLRSYFCRKGIVVPAAAIVSGISAHAVEAAPAGLLVKVSSAAVSVAGGGAAAGPVSVLTKQVIWAIAWAKMKVAVVVVVVASVLAGGAGYVIHQWLGGAGSRDERPQTVKPTSTDPLYAIAITRRAVAAGERWVVIPITTELQRVMTGPNARACVVVDGDWFARNRLTLDADALNLPAMRERLMPFVDAGIGTVHFRIRCASRQVQTISKGGMRSLAQDSPGIPATPDYVSSVLQWTLIGFGREAAGFRDATAEFVYAAGDDDSSGTWLALVADLKNGLAGDAGRDESGIGQEKFTVYSTRTALSRFLCSGADCVLSVTGDLGPKELDDIEQCVAKLELKSRRSLLVLSSAVGLAADPIRQPAFVEGRLAFKTWMSMPAIP